MNVVIDPRLGLAYSNLIESTRWLASGPELSRQASGAINSNFDSMRFIQATERDFGEFILAQLPRLSDKTPGGPRRS